MTPELLVQLSDGNSRTLTLDMGRVTLGRSSDNDLSYPDDPVLSRRHLVIERDHEEWYVEDLGSKNGTAVNGHRLAGRHILQQGDKISVGHVTLVFSPKSIAADETMVFVEEDLSTLGGSTSTSLDEVVGGVDGSLEAALASPALAGTPRMQALLDAGRQLADHRPLGELFKVILQLSTESVGARRGILMTLEENGELLVRATEGEGFRIPRAVRTQVIDKKQSLLVLDAAADEMFKSSMTIVQQEVRSLLAVPLQTRDKVIGLIYLDSPRIVRPFTVEDLTLLTVMANIAAIRIEHARLIVVEQAERFLAKELEQAAEIQRNLLPREAPIIPGYDLAGFSIACRMVGGDYYDFLRLPQNRVAVIVGDVAGKGLPAAMLMSSLQARVQVLAEEADDLSQFVTRLNRSVTGSCPGNRFITFFMAVFDPATGEFSYCNAGHNPPYLHRATGAVEKLEVGGPVLGILRQMQYQAAGGKLNPGDTLVMYSDGVSEAQDADQEEYGDDALLAEVIAQKGKSAKDILNGIRDAVEKFMGNAPAADDITLVVLRRT